MNQLKKLFAVAALTACVLPVAAQYPVIPDSVKIRGEQQQKEIRPEIRMRHGRKDITCSNV